MNPKRPVPAFAMPTLVEQDRATMELELSVITALFGGGVNAGISDELDPFRTTSIRGHLRFWWRATCGAGCTGHKELAKKEAQLWGATDAKSPIAVEVIKHDRGIGKPAIGSDGVKLKPEYALFPAQQKEIRQIYFGGTFTLKLTYPAPIQNELAAALWAWVTFGGIGARTRRGVGSLVCTNQKFLQPNGSLPDWLVAKARKYAVPGGTRAWPILTGAKLVLGPPMATAQAAWEKCLGFYFTFRRQLPYPQKKRSNRPEADTIRALQNIYPDLHEPRPPRGFPRAALGLPLIIKFGGTSAHLEPFTTTIEPTNSDRMASPVILRPIPSADGKFIPMLLLLNTQAEQFTNDLILKWTYEDKVEDSELCPRAPVGFPNNLLAQIAEAAASKEHWNTKVITL